MYIDQNDADQINPVVTFMGRSIENGKIIKWNGTNKKGKKLKAGDNLNYVLTVRDKEGHKDETRAHQINLVGADRLITENNTSNVSNARMILLVKLSPFMVHVFVYMAVI